MGARWTSAIGLGLRTLLHTRIAHLSSPTHPGSHDRKVQLDQLRHLLRLAVETEFGREHDFSSLLSLNDGELLHAYQRAVPMADYEGFRAQMERMREGAEPDVTWPGIVRDWAETSGTTGGQKYIPVSKQMMRSNRAAAFDIFAHASRMGVRLPGVFGGRILFLGGSSDVIVNEHGIRTGDLSGLVTPLITWPLSAVYAPGKDIALMSDWPRKIDAMAAQSLQEDIRAISGMASWSLVLFERVLEMARERDPSVTCIRDVWPNLRLFIHGGVKYGPFQQRVCRAWSGDPDGDIPARLEVYPASEGFIAMQDTAGDPGLRLSTEIGLFFEFIPLEQIDDPDAPAYGCWEVEHGQRYVVCMTTCAGLWRYIIGDVVEFETIPPAGPPRLRIVGRHRHFINAFGENLIVEEIENAVVAAATKTDLEIGEFTAAPVYPGENRPAGLELVMEATTSADHLRSFGAAFDEALRQSNVDYNTKRSDDLGMAPPTMTQVPPGTFHRWMASRGRLGGQNKCPRCANHREYVDGVAQQAQNEPAEAV